MTRIYLLSGCWLMAVGCAMPARFHMAQDLASQGRLVEAVDTYRKALPEVSLSSQRAEIEARIGTLLTSIAETALAHAASALGSGEMLDQYAEAIVALESKLKYDDQQNRIASRLADYHRQQRTLASTRDELIRAADEQVRDKQWSAAVRSLRLALHIKSDPQTLDRQRLAIQRRDEFFQRTIRHACDRDDWQPALSSLEQFRREDPRPPDSLLASLTTQVNDTKCNVVRRQVEQLRGQHKYFTAYTTLVDAQVGGGDDLLGAIRREGSRYYLEAGRRQLRDGDLFRAYLAAVKAKTLDPSDDEAFEFHRDCEDQVDASVRVQIGVAAFGSPTDEPDAGEEFSDVLISYLVDSLPYGIDIIERAKIDEVLKNHADLERAAELLGIHLAVVGNVSTLTVDKHRSERAVARRVKIGTDTVPNPQYDQFQLRYGPHISKWPHVPPQTIEKDRFEMIRYNRGEEHLEGVMRVSVRIFTADGGAITQAESFTAEDEAQDAFQDGVPEAGISDDALDMPTELKIKQRLMQDAVRQVAEWVLGNFEHRHGRYYAIAMSHLERREPDEAVRALAQAYLCCKRENTREDDAWTGKIRELALYKLTEPAG